jgi:hypothetical protein
MFAAKQRDLTPAQRAHVRRIVWLLIAYAVILPPLVWLRAHRHVSDALLLAMAIVASLPVLGMFASWGRYVATRLDALNRLRIGAQSS